MRISGNKGEWSELYVLIKLLADGKIYSADENLTKNEDCYMPILKIFRTEQKTRHIEYRCSNANFVAVYLNDILIRQISTSELARTATFFYNAIVHGKGEGAFGIIYAENFMKNLECEKLKVSSERKSDITMEVHDPFTEYKRICGFSIKSNLGSPPTLFNASQSTNFKFEVRNITEAEILQINSINGRSKVKERVKVIGSLKFVSVVSKTFEQNLFFIDTQMDKFLAEILKLYYAENISDCSELSKILDERDPLNFQVKNLYAHKLKKFLCAVALGLNPTKIWNGNDEANGGYIIVKEDGEILAYHLYNRNNFEDYLLQNTKLDTASTSRHNFGKIYVEGDKKFINLNLQVRFKK